MADQQNGKRSFIDRETLIPIGVCIALCVGAVGAYGWLNAQFQDIKALIEKIDRRVEKLEIQANTPVRDRWTGTDMLVWTREFQLTNPGIKIPDPVHLEPR